MEEVSKLPMNFSLMYNMKYDFDFIQLDIYYFNLI